jgi:hypothetical protein
MSPTGSVRAGWSNGAPPPQPPRAAADSAAVTTPASAVAAARRTALKRKLAEARRIVVHVCALLELFIVGMEIERALDERLLVLDVIRIRQTALDGTHRLASLVVVEADALRAELGIDDVDLLALADGLVRTLGLASAAVDAVCGDVGRHACVL